MAAARTADDIYARGATVAGIGWLNRAKSERVEILMQMGRYDEAKDLLDELEGLHLSPQIQAALRADRVILEGHLDPGAKAGPRLRAELETWTAFGDAQVQLLAEALRANSYALEGDWRRLAAAGSAEGDPSVPGLVIAAALFLRDAGAIARALDQIAAVIPRRGRLGVAAEGLAQGSLTYLGGDREAGITAMVSALDLFAKVLPPVTCALLQAAAAALIGFDHPAGLAVGTAARDYLRQVGARGLEAAWSAGLPAAPVADRQVG
jgi:hypothetical protein